MEDKKNKRGRERNKDKNEFPISIFVLSFSAQNKTSFISFHALEKQCTRHSRKKTTWTLKVRNLNNLLKMKKVVLILLTVFCSAVLGNNFKKSTGSFSNISNSPKRLIRRFNWTNQIRKSLKYFPVQNINHLPEVLNGFF